MSHEEKVREALELCVPPPGVKAIERQAKRNGSTLKEYMSDILTRHSADLILAEAIASNPMAGRRP